jgi:predicted Zn-dependent protease
MKKSIGLSVFLLMIHTSAFAQTTVLINAMKDELARSMGQLKLEGEAAPYYLSYMVEDSYMVGVAAECGGVMANTESRTRSVKIDLRVGSYAQDNSNFISGGSSISGLISSIAGSARLPIDDDYYVLRRELWMATDRAYKSALDNLKKKKSHLQNTVQTESIPDFSKGSATSSLATEITMAFDRSRLAQQVDQVAKLLTGRQDIQRSRVALTARVVNSYYINSEGATVIEPYSIARLTVSAAAQADDGMPINHFRAYTAARPEGLPEKTNIEADISKMISELSAARKAPLPQQYSGPVLFVGQAAGEFFRQGLSGFLAAKRPVLSDTSQFSRNAENPFLDKINMRVAANFLTVKAEPTLKNYGKQSLLGACAIDEEGVPCQDVSLIENGILKNLLTTRTPVKGFAQSNGHARGGAAGPSVIQLISTNKKPLQELKQELINSAKEEGLPCGYIVYGLNESMGAASSDIISALLSRQSGSEPNQFKLSNPYEIVRIYPDGKEEPVRGAEFGPLNINILRNILATSDDEIVYNFGVSSSGHYATVITPSLLINGIDVKKSSGMGYPKLPIVSPPEAQ